VDVKIEKKTKEQE